MQHRKIEQIEAEMATVIKKSKAIDRAKEAGLAAFKRQQDEKFKDDVDRLRAEASVLHSELEAARIAAAGHPLEGKVVYREDTRRDSSIFYRSKAKTIRLRGIVTVIRDYTDYPPRKNNDRFTQPPELGDVIIQRIDAKGNKLKGWEKMYPDQEGDLPRGWKLEEESK